MKNSENKIELTIDGKLCRIEKYWLTFACNDLDSLSAVIFTPAQLWRNNISKRDFSSLRCYGSWESWAEENWLEVYAAWYFKFIKKRFEITAIRHIETSDNDDFDNDKLYAFYACYLSDQPGHYTYCNTCNGLTIGEEVLTDEFDYSPTRVCYVSDVSHDTAIKYIEEMIQSYMNSHFRIVEPVPSPEYSFLSSKLCCRNSDSVIRSLSRISVLSAFKDSISILFNSSRALMRSIKLPDTDAFSASIRSASLRACCMLSLSSIISHKNIKKLTIMKNVRIQYNTKDAVRVPHLVYENGNEEIHGVDNISPLLSSQLRNIAIDLVQRSYSSPYRERAIYSLRNPDKSKWINLVSRIFEHGSIRAMCWAHYNMSYEQLSNLKTIAKELGIVPVKDEDDMSYFLNHDVAQIWLDHYFECYPEEALTD